MLWNVLNIIYVISRRLYISGYLSPSKPLVRWCEFVYLNFHPETHTAFEALHRSPLTGGLSAARRQHSSDLLCLSPAKYEMGETFTEVSVFQQQCSSLLKRCISGERRRQELSACYYSAVMTMWSNKCRHGKGVKRTVYVDGNEVYRGVCLSSCNHPSVMPRYHKLPGRYSYECVQSLQADLYFSSLTQTISTRCLKKTNA